MAVLIALRRLQSGQHSASLRVDHHKGDGPRKTKKADMAQQKMSLAPKKVRKWMKEELRSSPKDDRNAMLFEDEPYTQPELNVISAVQIDLSRLKNGERLRERTFVEYDGGRVGFLDVNLRRSRTSYKLTRLPAAIVNEVWEDVYRLQLSENDFSVGEPLPPLLAQAQKLYYLSLMGCRLRFIPNPLCIPPTLVILDLRKNYLTSIPKTILALKRLRILSIEENELKRLPTYLLQLPELATIQVAKNPLEYPPRQVWDLKEFENKTARDREITKRILNWLSQNKSNESTNGDVSEEVRSAETLGDSIPGDQIPEDRRQLPLSSLSSSTVSLASSVQSIAPTRPKASRATESSAGRNTPTGRTGLAPRPLNINKVASPPSASTASFNISPTSSFSSNAAVRPPTAQRTARNISPPVSRPATATSQRERLPLGLPSQHSRLQSQVSEVDMTSLQYVSLRNRFTAANKIVHDTKSVLNHTRETQPGIFDGYEADTSKIAQTLNSIANLTSSGINHITRDTMDADSLEDNWGKVMMQFVAFASVLKNLQSILPDDALDHLADIMDSWDRVLVRLAVDRQATFPSASNFSAHEDPRFADLADRNGNIIVEFDQSEYTLDPAELEELQEQLRNLAADEMSATAGPSSMSRSKQSRDEAVTIALHNLVAVVSSCTEAIHFGLSEYASSTARRTASSSARDAFNAATIKLEEAGDLAKTLTEPSSYTDATDTSVLHNQVRALLDTVYKLLHSLATLMNQDPALKEKLKEQGKTLMAAAKAAGAAVTVKSGSFERAAAPVEPITPINAAMGPAASRLVTGQETSKVFDKINKMRRGRF